MYRCLAAILLLPASLRVYPAVRTWITTLFTSPVCFFATVVRSGPLLIHHSPSCFHNLLVYGPMKLGIALLRNRSIRATARKAWRRWRQQGLGAPTLRHAGSQEPAPLPTTAVLGILQDPAIQTVSFDVFDTLLERPVLHPKDIFALVAAVVDARLHVDFVKMRWSAEEETGLRNARLTDIYTFIQKKYGLDDATTVALMEEELRCEERLLAPRADMRACYDEAVRQGKRIIAISDMYIPGETLHGILRRKGYTQISAVYVSCDYGKRKSDGTLYTEVLAAEKIAARQLLHVGDNRQADCQMALACGITAVYCPAPLARQLGKSPAFAAHLEAATRQDPFWSLLLGFGLQRLCARTGTAVCLDDLQDTTCLAEIVIAPLLTGYALSLAGDAELRRNYGCIHFASRDGFLPHKVYTVIAKHVPAALPGVYFLAGRRAYYPFLYESFSSYAAAFPPAGSSCYTLLDFIRGHFEASPLLEEIEGCLTAAEKELPFFVERQRCMAILQRFDARIASVLEEKRERARRYYRRVFSPEVKRHLVFDLGYSGSIGRALEAATGCLIDKLYFWQKTLNVTCDKAQGTRTRLFMRKADTEPVNLILEEVFSPCAGGVLDFDSQGEPVLENLQADSRFQADMEAIHTACTDFAEGFCQRLGDYAAYVHLACGDAAVDICHWLLAESPFCNSRLLRQLRFPDPLHYADVPSLEKKIEFFLPQRSVFSGTGFENPQRILRAMPALSEPAHIGMHVHIHNPALMDEMLCYLHNFPVPLDIFVSLTRGDAADAARHLFCRACIPQLRQARICVVPNRGRDVAPWVLGMRPFQSAYTLFCHIHAKESPHFDFGAAWRRYLLNNLLLPDAVAEILALFREQPRLGCLFPPPFPPLAALMKCHDIPPIGLKNEEEDACMLLRRMGLRGEICRSELFFSMGTMLWYRPDALRQLFSFALELEEFAEEPVGVEGTFAHAIERLPALIAERNGYCSGMYASSPL